MWRNRSDLATTKHVLRRNRNGVCHQKKQQSLHTQDILKNIGITRPSSARVLSPPPAEKHRKILLKNIEKGMISILVLLMILQLNR